MSRSVVVKFLSAALLVLGLPSACTNYTVAPDAHGGDAAGGDVKNSGETGPDAPGADKPADMQGDVSQDAAAESGSDVTSACSDPTLVSSCGPACLVCPKPTGGTATCDGQKCGMACTGTTMLCDDACIPTGSACSGACATGTHNCGGTCRANDDVTFCGGLCERCTAPQNGSATCNGACGVKCNNGFNLCGTSCKAATDPNACGPSCIKCDAPSGGSATCNGTSCGTPTCPNGQQNCNNACIDKNRSCNGVCSNGKYNCPDGVCRDTNTVASCGTACQPCPAKVNATASSCTNGTCGYTCNNGSLLCGDGTCGRTLWDFDDGTLQGLYAEGQTTETPETVTPSRTRAHSGSYSAAGRMLQDAGFYFITLHAPLCGSNGVDVSGLKISAWVYPDFATTDKMYICLGGNNQSKCIVAVGEWTYVETTLTGRLDIVDLEVMGSGTWTGRLYVDDVRVGP